jgi:hypothetical protein
MTLLRVTVLAFNDHHFERNVKETRTVSDRLAS